MKFPALSQLSIRELRPIFQWLILICVTLILLAIFEMIGIPASFLIAPMIGGILVAVLGTTITLPQYAFSASQAILGVLIAASLSPQLIGSFLSHWLLFSVIVLATVAASSTTGYLISRWRIMPGTTGVWGAAPGASTAMVVMAEAFGADSRLVAFMQYLRVVIVTAVAAFVAGLFVDTGSVVHEPDPWFPVLVPGPFAASLAVAGAGGLLGKLLRLPSPFFLGAMFLGVALEFSQIAIYQLPPWLLSISYLVIGWTIGLRFTHEIVSYVIRILPQITLSILLLILFCGGLAALLVVVTGIDPLTAYLATSPGGMDSVAIIAAASPNVNLSFVLSVQMLRFMFVLLFGPALARLVARLVDRHTVVEKG